MRQIGHLVSTISKRKNSEFKFHASIHGIELNTPNDEIENDVKLNEETEKLIAKRKQETLDRIKSRSKRG